MKRGPPEDEGLRRRALDALGALSPVLAREALDGGRLEVEAGVASWEGSLGIVEADRVVLRIAPDLAARVEEAPAVVDALTAAIANAIARVPQRALYALEIAPDAEDLPRATPYRGRA